MMYLLSFFMLFLTSCTLFTSNEISTQENTNIHSGIVNSISDESKSGSVITNDSNTSSGTSEQVYYEPQKFIKTKDGFTSSGTLQEALEYDGMGKVNLIKGPDGKYREEKFGYIVYNPESCNYAAYKGIYDRIDWNEDIPGYEGIIEAGCFKNAKELQMGYGTYLEDEYGTYYYDKDGGAYYMKRVSKKNGGTFYKGLKTEYEGEIDFTIPLFSIGKEVYLHGMLLSGVTSPKSLKVMPIKHDFYPFITDKKNIWSYKRQFEGVDPTSFKQHSGRLFVDNKSCYYYDILTINKLTDCNPKKIKRIADDSEPNTKKFFDGKNMYDGSGNMYDQNGNIIRD